MSSTQTKEKSEKTLPENETGNGKTATGKKSKKSKKAETTDKKGDSAAFKKKLEKLEGELEKTRMEEQKLREQLLRKVAEFDNYKRRTEKEFIENIQSASRELIEELLPVVDDFERTIEHAQKENPDSPVLKGVQLVYRNMMNTLSKRGLEVLDVVGKEFNPEEHSALMQVDSEEHESGVIVDQHLKGYKLNDKVIRHAQVLVAK